jgi:(p)ppGpp synthase/HD superfamily hydrolase
MDKIKWCITQHSNTNHMYDTYLPYEFHLRMVNHVAQKFQHLLDNEVDYFIDILEIGRKGNDKVTLREACLLATWGHDLIEDARVSYNDVRKQLGQAAADIIYAVTNEKGKKREERANDKYYAGIRSTPGAVFVKLCDRIANVQYSKMTSSRMFEVYREENTKFMQELGYNQENPNMLKVENVHDLELLPIFHYLVNLFNEN